MKQETGKNTSKTKIIANTVKEPDYEPASRDEAMRKCLFVLTEGHFIVKMLKNVKI